MQSTRIMLNFSLREELPTQGNLGIYNNCFSILFTTCLIKENIQVRITTIYGMSNGPKTLHICLVKNLSKEIQDIEN